MGKLNEQRCSLSNYFLLEKNYKGEILTLIAKKMSEVTFQCQYSTNNLN